ncbi:PREDICTED: ankyrin-3-like [Amphimedon queenslandica]|uniref:Uncharacterized protein n=1 Tax=Amphimedon queenslandica TaxID=400682 RepID=A0A1X7VV06_AMPQE|nr:PREDICTED: ankyrin-3-like [Amphimedon queenslandica]|eukprot:XP_011403405.1 PREDICTED: ankyrin-3-like [Amphimedon queenslandica]
MASKFYAEVSTTLEYELTDEEHDEMSSYIEKGFRDSLRKFLEGIATKKVATNGEKVILSPKTLNPDPSSQRRAPLAMAAMEGRIGILQLFLDVFKEIIEIDHGSFMTYPDLDHFGHKQVLGFKTRSLTALNAACVGGFTEMARVLLEMGADPNIGDYFGYTPLCNAARYGRAETVELLLRQGVDPGVKTHAGHTAIHLAALHGQAEVVKVMISKNADLLFPKSSSPSESSVPCPLFLAAANGWQPVVDLFVSHAACPRFCKIDAKLLLGAASRMFWTKIKEDSMKGVIDLWIEARVIKDGRKEENESSLVYKGRQELTTEADLKSLLEHPNVEEESLYQCLLIHERCMGSSNSYNWVFLAGMKMYQRKHYSEAEELWKRAMGLHYEIATQNVGLKYWQHDLKGTMEYMIQFGSAIEGMVKNGYQPMWEEYVDYALQQLKMGILTSLHTNILDASTGILKVYYALLQIFSCWISKECSRSYVLSSSTVPLKCSDSLNRAGQTFVDTASVLTQSNLLHLAIYPSASLRIRWQTSSRLPLLIQALLNWGAINSIDELDHHGNRPIHVAVRLPDKESREAIVSVLVQNGVHSDALNKDGKTPRQVFGVSYPQQSLPHITDTPSRLKCLSASALINGGVPYNVEDVSGQLLKFIQLHDLKYIQSLTVQQWITLPRF